MKNFEMPKMNISIFSEENIVTDSLGATNLDAAKAALTGAGVNEGNVTVTSFNDWTNA